jgi:hypothetical protein
MFGYGSFAKLESGIALSALNFEREMKIGLRTPSPRKAFASRTSPARVLRHSFGLKAPRGAGFLVSPRRASYNFVYRRATFPLGGALSAVLSPFVLYVIVTSWSAIVFLFWTLVVLFAVLMFIALWVRYGRPSPRNKPASISTAPAARATTDYTKWSKAKWMSWKESHLKEIASGQRRVRPAKCSLWTDEERLDWEKEEWLRVVVKIED